MGIEHVDSHRLGYLFGGSSSSLLLALFCPLNLQRDDYHGVWNYTIFPANRHSTRNSYFTTKPEDLISNYAIPEVFEKSGHSNTLLNESGRKKYS